MATTSQPAQKEVSVSLYTCVTYYACKFTENDIIFFACCVQQKKAIYQTIQGIYFEDVPADFTEK